LEIIQMLDLSCLRPEADEQAVRRTCAEALEYGYAAVFVMPYWLPLSASMLKGSRVKAGVPLGFPFGSHTTFIKVCEARDAIANGAEELDMMMNVGALKSRNYDLVERDIQAVVEAAQGRIVKVILETCLLTDEEKKSACQIVESAGADFVKTSTGFSTCGATVADVRLLRASVTERVRVKAAGGIDSFEQARELVEAGAVRLGTSKTLMIVQEAQVAAEARQVVR
jgi:deoxyribose-phosphate aldolase